MSGDIKKIYLLASSQRIKLRKLRSHASTESVEAELCSDSDSLKTKTNNNNNDLLVVVDSSFPLKPNDELPLSSQHPTYCMTTNSCLTDWNLHSSKLKSILFSSATTYLDSSLFLFGLSLQIRKRSLLDLFRWGFVRFNWSCQVSIDSKNSLEKFTQAEISKIAIPIELQEEARSFCKFWRDLESGESVTIEEVQFVDDALRCGIMFTMKLATDHIQTVLGKLNELQGKGLVTVALYEHSHLEVVWLTSHLQQSKTKLGELLICGLPHFGSRKELTDLKIPEKENAVKLRETKKKKE